MAFLNRIDQLKNIDWARTYLWDVCFPDAPPPFDTWFPATDITWEIASLQSLPIDSPNGQFKVPQICSAALGIQLSFHDDSKHTLLNWFVTWMSSIVYDKRFVLPLLECSRQIQIQMLSYDREPLKTYNFYVYPEGEINFVGDSNSSPGVHQINFVITGEV